jgi:hypothetical protein
MALIALLRRHSVLAAAAEVLIGTGVWVTACRPGGYCTASSRLPTRARRSYEYLLRMSRATPEAA